MPGPIKCQRCPQLCDSTTPAHSRAGESGPSVLLDKTGLMRLSSQGQFGKGWSIFQGNLSPMSLGDRRALQGWGWFRTDSSQHWPAPSQAEKAQRNIQQAGWYTSLVPCPTDVAAVPLGTGSPGQFLGHGCRSGVRRLFLLSEPDLTSQISASLSENGANNLCR